MEISCPIDAQFSDQISTLLTPPSPHHVQEYFDQLITTKQCRVLKVKPTGEYGKCVYADMDFEEGDLILKDQMLVGAQHPSNKIDCCVCGFCFRFIGSIELQIGRKLYLQGLGASVNNECDTKMFSHNPKDCFRLDSSSSEDGSDIKNHPDLGECSSSSSREKTFLPMETIESLMHEELALPYSKQFPFPSIISCSGGCGEVFYCSKSCADADWDSFHSLLCTGDGSKSLNKKALAKFIQHANETNDIFLLAAKAISSTILKYRKLKAACHKKRDNYPTPDVLGSCDFSLLLEAWKPLSMGYKKRWWDCIALPCDVDYSEEAAFRMQIRQLAFESLQLLKAAIFDKECEPLLSLEIYGHIIGMFELNNLDLVVASPVEDYFLYIDDLPETEKKKAYEITHPFLNAPGEDYSELSRYDLEKLCNICTTFFPLQSCMNHSCYPNGEALKREEDRDGQASNHTCMQTYSQDKDLIYRQ